MSEGFRILDKLFKDEDKKNFRDNLKKEAEVQKSLEHIDKLLLNKHRGPFLDNLKKIMIKIKEQML